MRRVSPSTIRVTTALKGVCAEAVTGNNPNRKIPMARDFKVDNRGKGISRDVQSIGNKFFRETD